MNLKLMDWRSAASYPYFQYKQHISEAAMKSQHQYLIAVVLAGMLVSGQTVGGLNGDSDLDAVFTNIGQTNRACLGDGAGGFDCSNVSADTGPGRNVGLGDLNADGAVDAVFANVGAANRVCLGDGTGSFVCSDVSADTRLSLDVGLGYIDLDGNLDAVFANMDSNSRVCLGNGNGGFSCSDIAAVSAITGAVALGHIDGDGLLDAVFANGDFASQVCLGNGSAGFACSNVRDETTSSIDVALGDVNGDGDLDAVIANTNIMSWVCLGDGTGGFSCSDVSSAKASSQGVALGDLNRDGDLDVVFANVGEPDWLCLGDGSGGFACDEISDGEAFSYGVSLGDLNRDGNLDAVFANGGGQRNRVCLGNGAGEFTCSDVSTDSNDSSGVGLAGDVPPPSLSLSKSSTSRVVTESGQVVNYQYVVRNLGPITAHDVAIEDDNVDATPLCAFSGNVELQPAGAPGSIVACGAQHTATAQEIASEGSLDNTATASSDETQPVMASLSIPIGISLDGFEGPSCPCWTLEEIAALPLPGEEADCVSDLSQIYLTHVTGCEYHHRATFSELGLSCGVNRFNCPDLPDTVIEIETTDSQFFACLDQIVTRCEDLGIEPPPFP
jgi:uncharacterized repeat protein (TIGR01451 family)